MCFYPCQGVIGELLVGPAHHLVAVVVSVQRPVVLQRGAGPEDDLSVEGQGAYGVALFQPVTQQPVTESLWDAGGDGVDVVLIVHLPTEGKHIFTHCEIPLWAVGTGCSLS